MNVQKGDRLSHIVVIKLVRKVSYRPVLTFGNIGEGGMTVPRPNEAESLEVDSETLLTVGLQV